MSDLKVHVLRTTISPAALPYVGPFVTRDGDNVIIGFTRDWKEKGYLTPIDNAFREPCFLPETGDRIEGAVMFDLNEARIVLRGLLEAIGVEELAQEDTADE